MVACVSCVSCLCIHLFIFAWYIFVLHYEQLYLEMLGLDPNKLSYGGNWKYLTYINLVLQTVFFGLCVLTDIVHLTFTAKLLHGGVQSLLVKLRDDLFTGFAFPYAMFVFSMFWSAYAVDCAQFTPLKPGASPPSELLNHARHTIIMPLVLVQMYIQNHTYASRLKGFLSILFSGLLYGLWLHWVHHESGIWVYTFLCGKSLMSLVVIHGVCIGSLLLIQLLGEKLSGRIWRSVGTQKKGN